MLGQMATDTWMFMLAHPSAGLRTVKAIRLIFQQWLSRRFGTPNFRLTQVVSGHGYFGSYQCRIGLKPTARYHHYDNGYDGPAEHTLKICPAWSADRNALSCVIGADLSLLSFFPLHRKIYHSLTHQSRQIDISAIKLKLTKFVSSDKFYTHSSIFQIFYSSNKFMLDMVKLGV